MCQNLWKYTKLIPLINTIFGLVIVIRSLINVIRDKDRDRERDRERGRNRNRGRDGKRYDNWQEAIKSGVYAIGGIAAVLIPISYGVAGLSAFLLCSLINNFIVGLGSFIVDIWSDECLRNAYYIHIEDVIYKRVIKATPLIAVGYCPIRALVYLIYGDKRNSKALAKDLIINIISIAIAYVVFLYIDTSNLGALNKENSFSIQNGFVPDALNCIRALIFSQIFILSAAQCINVGAQLLRNSSLLMEAEFPYNKPEVTKFIECLQNPNKFIRNDSNKEYMKSHLIHYVVKCLVAGYKDKTNEAGQSALELAFQSKNPALFQAVIAFMDINLLEKDKIINMLEKFESYNPYSVIYILGRCINILDNELKSILNISLRQFFVVESYCGCCHLYDQYTLNFKSPIVNLPVSSGPFRGKRVLTIEGGGTRGLVSLEILRQLEKLCSGVIRDNFDLIVGTSPGGLIALLIADGKSCEYIQKFYFELKDKVFCGRKGNVSAFEAHLKDIFGDRIMGSIPNSTRVIITASLVQNNEFIRMDFSNFHKKTMDVPIWKVALCTAAAPGYFPPFNYKEDKENKGEHLLDGGLTANNPVFIVFDHLGKCEIEDSVIVSIGTGKYYRKIVSSQKLNVSRSIPGFVRMVCDGTLSQFIDLVVNQATQTEGDIVDNAKIMCQLGKGYFYRLNPLLCEKIELNETNDEKLVNAIWHSNVFAIYHNSIIEEIYKIITSKQMFEMTRNESDFQNRYEDNYDVIDVIKSGVFGVIYKVWDKSDQNYYAIKMFEIIEVNKRLFELNFKYVIRDNDFWTEEKVRAGSKINFLFIKMEWCSYNLKRFLNEMKPKKSKIYQIFKYFISCELLIELIECVNYLHSLRPRIYHRELNAENILISDGINGRFLKLSDFGLQKLNEESDHSKMVEFINYKGADILKSKRSDIYSLALIAIQIFTGDNDVEEIMKDINLFKYLTFYSSPDLKEKFKILLKILSDCLFQDYLTPDSGELMYSINKWTVDTNTVLWNENIEAFRQTLDKNEILKNFFETKLCH